MIEIILKTLNIMMWLGISLSILAIVNILTGLLVNTWTGKEKFSFNKLIKGILKVIIFYICSVLVSIAFTIIPFINQMIEKTFQISLFSNDVLNTFSSVGVLTIVVAALIVQAKKAINGIKELANISLNINDESLKG